MQISANLKSGRIKSCGCQRYIELSERNKKHGMAGTRIYRIGSFVCWMIYSYALGVGEGAAKEMKKKIRDGEGGQHE